MKLQIYSKLGKCKNCGETEELYKVKKGNEIIGWCECCLQGLYLEQQKNGKLKSITNKYF